MSNYSLIPKFNYDFSISDLSTGIKAAAGYSPDLSALTKYFNTPHIYFTNYGRTGLRLILSAISPGKPLKIGVQVYNCLTVFRAIKNARHEPVYLDIADNFTIDPQDLRKKADGIDALIVNHTFGIPADFAELKKIIGNKPIIEDCAHSLFSTYHSKPTGTLGDAAIFSFGFGKYPSIGKGGMTLINNRSLLWDINNLYEKLSRCTKIEVFMSPFRDFIYSLVHNRFLYGTVTYPLGRRMDARFDFTNKFAFQESKGIASEIAVFLKKFPILLREKNCIQQDNGRFLYDRLKNIYACIKEGKANEFNYYLFPIRDRNRDEIAAYLYRQGIEAGKHFARSIEWARHFGYQAGSCPNAEKSVNEIFVIPANYNLTRKHLAYIVERLRRYKDFKVRKEQKEQKEVV